METRINTLAQPFAKVSQLLESELNLNEIAPRLIEVLCLALNCQWGTYWEVCSDLGQLRPLATWVEATFEAPALSRDTKNRTLSLSEGTAGHVWRSRKPVWTQNLIKDMCLPRSLDADSSGLTGGIWFALKTEDTVYAVVELLGRRIFSPTEELIVGLESFGIHLGHLLETRLKDARDVTQGNV